MQHSMVSCNVVQYAAIKYSVYTAKQYRDVNNKYSKLNYSWSDMQVCVLIPKNNKIVAGPHLGLTGSLGRTLVIKSMVGPDVGGLLEDDTDAEQVKVLLHEDTRSPWGRR
jgi:hypothetical protein